MPNASRSRIARQTFRRRGPSKFTQADVARVLRAAKRVNVDIACVRIEPDGSIVMVLGRPASSDAEINSWD